MGLKDLVTVIKSLKSIDPEEKATLDIELTRHIAELTKLLEPFVLARTLKLRSRVSQQRVTQLVEMHQAALDILSKENVDLTKQIADMDEELRVTKQESIQDELTHLLNRRGFTRILIDSLRDRRHRSPWTLIFIDLRNFKWWNDTYGHQAGDQALMVLGNLISSRVPGGAVGRVGGDEFAILIENCDYQGAQAVSKRLSQEVDNSPWAQELAPILQDKASQFRRIVSRFRGGFRPIHLNMGVVCLELAPDISENHLDRETAEGIADAVLRKADEAMYRAKRRAKVQSLLYGDSSNYELERYTLKGDELELKKLWS
ncbi:MAG: diguanylate cyclase [Candidatus Yanofskybacteria bacterium]|nr:diguanylate cyclase [Candidatus Yanofskybacteria bacterium]